MNNQPREKPRQLNKLEQLPWVDWKKDRLTIETS